MSELHLIVPGACGPLAEIQSLQKNAVLSHWVKVLSRATSTASYDNLHDVIKSVFNLSIDGDLPSAALTMLANGLYDDSLNYLHADPVHLRADMDHAILSSAEDLSIDNEEAEQLCEVLNQHFNQDDLKFYKINNDQWVLSSKNKIQMTTTPLVDAIGRNVNFILPQGKDSSEWKKILTEAQMLMYSHQVNETRESSGHQTINSIWFYGSGQLPEMVSHDITSVRSNNDIFKGLASKINCDYSPLPNNVNDYLNFLLSNKGEGINVLHISELEHVVNYTDVSIWLEKLTQVLNDWIYPMLKFANKNNIKVKLYPCNNKQYHFSKYDAVKFWCQGSFDQHISSYQKSV